MPYYGHSLSRAQTLTYQVLKHMKKLACLLLVILAVVVILSYGVSTAGATTLYLQRAVDHVRIESNNLSTQFPSVPREYFIAMSALGYVNNQVNPYSHSFYKGIGDTIDGVEEALDKQAGLCGTQSWVYATLVRELGVQARTIQVFQMDRFNGSTHVMEEVWFNNKWNLIDITTATFFRDSTAKMYELMSFDEISNKTNYNDYIVTNQSGTIYQAWKYKNINPFPYIMSITKDVLISRKGVLNLYPVGNSYSLTNLESHVGIAWFKLDNCYGDVSYKLHNITGYGTLRLVSTGNGGIGNLVFIAGNKQKVMPMFTGEKLVDLTELDLSQGLLLKAVPTTGSAFYCVFSSISKQ